MDTMNLVKLTENAIIPTSATDCSAGYDMYTNNILDIEILPNTCVKVPTGIAIQISEGYYGSLKNKSGIATTTGILIVEGVIDNDYRGEILIMVRNVSNGVEIIKPYTKLAQLVLSPYIKPTIIIVENLNNTVRGKKGFGELDI